MSGCEAGWTILIHGGAKTIAPEDERANREGLDEAVRAGAGVLQQGGTALAAVEAAIRVMEERPVFNAGSGSVANRDGGIELDAAIMDGATLAIGAVAALPLVRHPISVAREVLAEREILLAGQGALAFARDCGAELRDPEERGPVRVAASAGSACDTVGALARDGRGNFAAATSTGGLEGTLAGRVGDSPLPGCGFYADNTAGAVALSGDGEDIARLALAARIIDKLGRMDVKAALECSLTRIAQLGAEAGAIALDKHGNPGFAHNSRHFAVASLHEGETAPAIWLSRHEEQGR
ncbi:isoaspartyl peptidase/L-asparaginase family protein [Erythrobacter donghaensis]|jgi:beta-aspartyl-peptidase (threonine type)|uniref:isoaspartyl peptidase/L-asparaginase family protein n=1 Tax=Erythrobacter donghaensis TaxID=267135 RepID=UPI000939EFBC|nr:isoaspartyl peptidase/L-asparaginase family protein [Erythrobacter donghaensis]